MDVMVGQDFLSAAALRCINERSQILTTAKMSNAVQRALSSACETRDTLQPFCLLPLFTYALGCANVQLMCS